MIPASTKVKLTRTQLIELYSVLEELARHTYTSALTYCIARTLGVLKPELDAIRVAVRIPPEGVAYENERLALAKAAATKDDKGAPIMRANHFEIPDLPAFQASIDALKEKHKFDPERFQQKNEELLSGEIELEIRPLPIAPDAIPANMTAAQLLLLRPIVFELPETPPPPAAPATGPEPKPFPAPAKG
jgi:hypothetical protein